MTDPTNATGEKPARKTHHEKLANAAEELRTALGLPRPGNVSEYAAALYLGVSAFTLQKDRQHARRWPYFRSGGRVLYSLERLAEVVRETSEGGPATRRRERGAKWPA